MNFPVGRVRFRSQIDIIVTHASLACSLLGHMGVGGCRRQRLGWQ
jgi:hypothetical protein